MKTDAFIQLVDVSREYHLQDRASYALKNISLNIDRGESWAICGSSGAGKSTLLNIIGGLDSPTKGEVWVDGKNVTNLSDSEKAIFRQKDLGFVFQFHNLLSDFTVLENVMMPLLISGKKKAEAQEKACRLLGRVDILDKKDRFSKELSGGEQQRVAIARALIHEPKLVLADEPTGNLDEENGKQVFDLLCELNKEKETTLLVVSHQIHFAKKLNHILYLDNGQISSMNA